jgi:hypothetical protein
MNKRFGCIEAVYAAPEGCGLKSDAARIRALRRQLRCQHRFRRKRDQGWQNVPEQWRGNVQTEGLREAE